MPHGLIQLQRDFLNTMGLNTFGATVILSTTLEDILCHGHDSRELFVVDYRVTERYNTIYWNNLEINSVTPLKNNNSNHEQQ